MDYKKIDQYKKLISFLQGLVIIAIEIVLFSYVWIEKYYSNYSGAETFRGSDMLPIVLYTAVLYGFTKLNGGYKFGHLRLMDIIFSQLLSITATNVIFYFVVALLVEKLDNPIVFLALTFIEWILILLYNSIVHLIDRKIYPPRKLLLIYGDKGPEEMLDTFGSRTDKFYIAAEMSADTEMLEILRNAANYDGIIIHRVQPDFRNLLLRICYENDIRAYVVPNIADIVLWSSDETHLFDIPLLITRYHGITKVESFFKRIIDLVGAFVMMVLTSPLMLVIALIVKLYDGGPVIYKQERVTKDGKHFFIYKFRSMKLDAEENGARLASREDDRITPFGRFIRSVHLDELPQVFNILKGEMSLVGPRPERPEIIERYKNEIPEFDYRLKVKAGLTGYAQVYGRYSTASYNKLKLDMMYIEHYSLWLDLKLLFLTFKIIFIKDNSNGVEEGNEEA